VGRFFPIRRLMRRRRKERGASLVEASLIMPIMIAILLGTIETGVAFKDYLTVSFSSREGARVGALAGNDPDADCAIVTSVIDALGSQSSVDNLFGLQIYRADPATGDRIAADTNTWILAGTDPYDCDSDWTITENWASTSRKTTFGTSSQLDIIGVRIYFRHDWLTGFPPFSGFYWVDESTITRMEPEAFA